MLAWLILPLAAERFSSVPHVLSARAHAQLGWQVSPAHTDSATELIEITFCIRIDRQQELEAERSGEWPGIRIEQPCSTHVDRLFGYVEEQRLLCAECRSGRCVNSSGSVLSLPLPESENASCTVNDL